ncbi:MAG: hypothetical protein VB858_06525, partial [Planctomycetaceae bacterium]
HTRLYEKYNIHTIVICKALQQGMRDALDQMPHWQTIYEDDIAIVSSRDQRLIESSASYEPPLDAPSTPDGL